MRDQAIQGDLAASRALALDLEVLVEMVLEVVLVAMMQLLAQWLME
jgi:hypothetical protein